MKNLVLTITGLLIGIFSNSLQVKAQVLPNPDFEQVVNVSGVDHPVGWSANPNGTSVSTMSHAGNYSLAVWNWYYYSPGYAQNGAEHWIPEAYKGGTPYTAKAIKLTGFYHYDTTGTDSDNDSAFIAVLLKKYNTGTQQVDTVGYGMLRLPHHAPGDNSFASFEVPITDLQPGINPDSIVVFVRSSENGFCSTSGNGNCLYFYVDQLALETIMGTTDLEGNEMNILLYPNPANDLLTLQFNDVAKRELFIYTSNGALVYSEQFSASKKEINTSSLSSGLYFIHCVAADGSFSQKKVIIE